MFSFLLFVTSYSADLSRWNFDGLYKFLNFPVIKLFNSRLVPVGPIVTHSTAQNSIIIFENHLLLIVHFAKHPAVWLSDILA